jgi:predicted lipid-binding transport protein (Tim44 family)
VTPVSQRTPPLYEIAVFHAIFVPDQAGTPDARLVFMRVTEEATTQGKVHEVRNTSAVAGAVVGATAGILGGIMGIGAAGLLGAVFGALGGLALEHDIRQSAAREHERQLELEREARSSRVERETAAGIEPACPDCLEAREESGGAIAWCARHTKHRPHGQLHYAYPPSFAMGSMLLRPAA